MSTRCHGRAPQPTRGSRPNGGESNQGSSSVTVDYTIDFSNLRITAVSDNDYRADVGSLTWFLINPQGLSQGGTVTHPWYGTDARFSVASQTANVKGVNLDAWSLNYTGQATGYWHVEDVYPKGPETFTYFYDTAYGILLGRSVSGSFTLTGEGGGWTETLSETAQFEDSSLDFSKPSFFFQPYILGGIAVVIVLIVLAFLVMRRKRLGKSKATPQPRVAAETPPTQTQALSATQFCIHCGKPNPADARFCSSCGKGLET